MDCPKCKNKMTLGEIAHIHGRGGKLFWAEKDYFHRKMGNYFSKRSVEKEGGILIPALGGVLTDRTAGYACKECRLVVIECN